MNNKVHFDSENNYIEEIESQNIDDKEEAPN